MVLPAGIGPALEVVEAQFGLEFFVLLLDRPSLVPRVTRARSEAVAGRSTKQYFTRGFVAASASPRRARLAQQAERKAPFFLKSDRRRNPRLLPGLRGQPGLA
jgi:hypothetical protein